MENKYDKKELRDLIEAHVEATGSKLGAKVLADFDYYLPHFKKLIPNEYKKMITLSAKLEEKDSTVSRHRWKRSMKVLALNIDNN